MKRLSELTSIRLGFYEKQPQSSGSIAYLQVKHIDPKTERAETIDTFINDDKGLEGHLLKEGDVVFAAKGTRNYAWTYDEVIGKAVASTAFIIIQPNTKEIRSHFLTILLNHPIQQAKFQQLVAGSSMPSIRKQDMEELLVAVPDLKIQDDIINLHKAMVEDRVLTNALLLEKEKLVQTVIRKIIQ